jgi:hypothetical protein
MVVYLNPLLYLHSFYSSNIRLLRTSNSEVCNRFHTKFHNYKIITFFDEQPLEITCKIYLYADDTKYWPLKLHTWKVKGHYAGAFNISRIFYETAEADPDSTIFARRFQIYNFNTATVSIHLVAEVEYSLQKQTLSEATLSIHKNELQLFYNSDM